MTGGLKKTTSRLAIATIASVVASGAFAADLGGNCCADLEERVAELEATTARKGNRKVSLTVSGHVNEAIIFWDDGTEKNAYVVSNNNSRSRFRFVGDAKISSDWSAGYLMEIGVRYAGSGSRQQFSAGNGNDATRPLDIRHSAWWMENKTLGRVWVGKTTTATDGITEINLANVQTVGSDPSAWNGNFFLRSAANPTSATVGGPAGTTVNPRWNGVTPSFAGAWNAGEGDRNTTVKYVSPTHFGFTFSSAWGEDDIWDTALRYAGEFNGVRLAGGVGYKMHRDNPGKTGSDGPICADLSAFATVTAVDCHAFGLSGSMMHVPTGLYVSGSYGYIQDDNRRALYNNVAGIKDKDEHWYIQAGLERNHFGIGLTTIYGEYGQFEAGAGLTGTGAIAANFAAANVTGGLGQLASAETKMWGLGINQQISAANMDLYLSYRNFELDAKSSANGSTTGVTSKLQVNDFSAVMMGAIIRF
jgi:hypothetical protein